MTDALLAGEDRSAGHYVCTTCGYLLIRDGPVHLPPCPECHNHHWLAQTGGTPLAEDGPLCDTS